MSNQSQVFGGNERFPIVRRLGSGGMGVVYEVLDRARGHRAALKTLKAAGPDALYRFKREFRLLADLSHPNLISLYELFSTGDEWFFTMEYVDGTNLREALQTPTLSANDETTPDTTLTSAAHSLHPDSEETAVFHTPVRSRIECDPARLRPLMRQLAEGLNALHMGGILHRDLKPSNVMVTRDNRVVILDFGISASLDHSRPDSNLDGAGIAGTADFMSPEQAAGEPLSEASDWYAVGVILFQALTGQLPFRGANFMQRLREKRRRDAPRPSTVCEGVPADLDDLCAGLLAREPGARPTGVQVLRAFGAVPMREAVQRAQQSLFVGREGELLRMREALRISASAPVLLCVRGKSGLGKSALVARFLDDARLESENVVLSGRCYEQESVPYKALDTLMDDLSRFLRRLPAIEAAALLPRDIGALAQMFPVLSNVPAVASAPLRKSDALDTIAIRKRAGEALRELVARIGDRWRLVIAIDDLHWGDVDSAQLLAQVLEAPDAPSLLLVCSLRSDQEKGSRFLDLLFESTAHAVREDVDINPLTAPEVMELSRLIGASAAVELERAEVIARECGGNAFFVREMLGNPLSERDDSGNLDSMLWNRAQRLPENTRRLLELVAVSGRPIPLWLALRAVHLEDEGFAAYTALRSMRLVRRTGTSEPELIESYHDRIRETLVARLTPDGLRDNYRRLARSMEASGSADPEPLAVYLEGCEEKEKAGRQYALAAQRAQEALAFDRSVSLYRKALDLSRLGAEERRLLEIRFGEALANAGRAKEAAERFEAAAEGATGAVLADLRQRAAYYYCISGQVDQGKAAFRRIVTEKNMRWPESNGQAIAMLLAAQAKTWFSGFAFKQLPQGADAAPEIAKSDLCWSVAIGIGAVDMVTAACFSSRGVNASLRTGDKYRVARSLCWEIAYAATVDTKRAAKLLEAVEPLVRDLRIPYIDGMFILARAIDQMNKSHWREARDLFDQAEAIWLEHCTGVEWELATARNFGYWALEHCGYFHELIRRIRLRRREAEERGNLYVATSIGVYPEPMALLMEDKPEEAMRRIESTLQQWTKGYSVQHCLAGLTVTPVLVYSGKDAEAWEHAKEAAARMKEAQMMRMDLVRATGEMRMLTAALLAKDQGAPDALGAARKLAVKMSGEKLPWARAFAEGALACLALHDGQTAHAVKRLEEFVAQSEAMGFRTYPAVGRRALGFLQGGEDGRRLVAEAEDAMRAIGIANPEKAAPLCLAWRPERRSR